MSPLRIAQLAPLMEAVPPARYGGTERVVHWLSEELVRRGHRVTLFASGDSRTSATLEPIAERALRAAAGDRIVDPVAWHLYALGCAAARAHEFDVVHSHLDYLPFPLWRGLATPLVTTLHGRLDIDGLAPIFRRYAEFPLVSISDAQRAPLPWASWIRTVYHGLPLREYAPGPGGGGYLVFLGRISPEKRPHVAIGLARRLGVRLVLAAKIDAADRRYFHDEVEPLLTHPCIEFVGEVDDAEKAILLQNATALLFPIRWPEPFGLAMIEAMAYGTPVITCRCGSTPELVAHGRVGWICDDDAELAEAVARAERIDRAACRAWVEERFSVERMADAYEAIYRSTPARALIAAEPRALALPLRDRRGPHAPPPVAPEATGALAPAP